MTFWRQFEKAELLAEEIQEFASYEDFEQLAYEIESEGIPAVWGKVDLGLALDFLTTSNRKAKKFQKNVPYVYLGAYVLARIAHRFLGSVCYLQDNLSKKSFLKIAAESAIDFHVDFRENLKKYIYDFFPGSYRDYLP
jgi:hypothetical protein